MMRVLKLTTIGVAAVIAAILVLAAPGAVRAQNIPATVAATMDSQRILRDTKAAQSIGNQIRTYADQLQNLIKGEEDALKAKQNELRQQVQAKILTPEAITQRQGDLQKSYQDAQRLIQDRRQAIDRTRQQAFEVMKGQIGQIIEELQTEKGFNIVFDRSAYSWGDPSLDITSEIITRLDQRLPSVKVARPEGF